MQVLGSWGFGGREKGWQRVGFGRWGVSWDGGGFEGLRERVGSEGEVEGEGEGEGLGVGGMVMRVIS